MNLTMHQRSPGRRRDLDFSRSPIRDRDGHPPSHPTKSSLHARRLPVHHRSPPGMKSFTRNGRSERKRSPTKERMREHIRSPRNDRSKSPVKKKMTSSVRSSRQVRSRSPVKDKSPYHARSPKYIRSTSPVDEKITNHARPPTRRRSRSPAGQRFPEHHKSPRRIHSGSPISSSRSPSPHPKHLRQAQVERDTDKTSRRQEVKDAMRDHNRGRNREKEVDTNVSEDRKLARDKRDGGTSRSSRHAGDHSLSPLGHGYRHEHGVRSPSRTSKTAAHDELSGEEDSVSRMKVAEEALEAKQKQKPSFELSGKLAEETNRVRGVTLLFTEPSDARKPDIRWRLYVFKAGEVLNEPLYVHRQSCYLFGRERRVADIPTDHPSCSKQHAVLQYRLVEKEQPDGLLSKQVRPYVMDLGSTNGTFLNDERIEPQRYYELCEKDVIKFGNSSREYVVLHENSVK